MDLTGRGYLYAAIKVFLLQTCPHQPYKPAHSAQTNTHHHTHTHHHTLSHTPSHTITHTHTPSHTHSHTHTNCDFLCFFFYLCWALLKASSIKNKQDEPVFCCRSFGSIPTSLSSLLVFLLSFWQVEALPITARRRVGCGGVGIS
jgi:hypothetical protein